MGGEFHMELPISQFSVEVDENYCNEEIIFQIRFI